MKILYSILTLAPFLLFSSSARGIGKSSQPKGQSGDYETCETSYNVPSCSPCQNTLYSYSLTETKIDKCIFKTDKMSFDTYQRLCIPEYKSNAYDDCNEKTATDIANDLLSSCAYELNNINKNGTLSQSVWVSLLNKYFSIAYFAVPAFKAICIPDRSNGSNGYDGFCGLNVVDQFRNHSLNLNVALFPPNGHIGDANSNIKIPNEILCSDCYLKITNAYLSWLSAYQLPNNISVNGYISGLYVNEFNESQMRDTLIQACGSNSLTVVDNSTYENTTTPKNTSSTGERAMPDLRWLTLIGPIITAVVVLTFCIACCKRAFNTKSSTPHHPETTGAMSNHVPVAILYVANDSKTLTKDFNVSKNM
ncbi:9463_t:CDS:2 [Ambispora gerdemannii]|uniref:9463_t:CDS:1 n=1 Tax=Ambispora gerdemannii TaxID=144530 RepID=A0A9N9GET8_9GLOM|nr:9463_t:CDS:2 [Ambispora gerdemannii]